MSALDVHPVAERAQRDDAPLLVYFSSESGNTARFVEKLGLRAVRLPADGEPPQVDEPFVLLTPTYSGGEGGDIERGAVPTPVIRFLNVEQNRDRIRGVISLGNSNFGASFGLAGDIISRKCRVPHLSRVELFGTPEDVDRVKEGLERWWKRH